MQYTPLPHYIYQQIAELDKLLYKNLLMLIRKINDFQMTYFCSAKWQAKKVCKNRKVNNAQHNVHIAMAGLTLSHLPFRARIKIEILRSLDWGGTE